MKLILSFQHYEQPGAPLVCQPSGEPWALYGVMSEAGCDWRYVSVVALGVGLVYRTGANGQYANESVCSYVRVCINVRVFMCGCVCVVYQTVCMFI